MKSRMMKLITLINAASVLGFGSFLTTVLWQKTGSLTIPAIWPQLFLGVGLILVCFGVLFASVQAWRLFTIINRETTYRYQTLTVLNWLKRGSLLMTAGFLVDWWPVYLIADQSRSPLIILIIVIITILVGSIAVLAAMFQDVLITSRVLRRDD